MRTVKQESGSTSVKLVVGNTLFEVSHLWRLARTVLKPGAFESIRVIVCDLEDSLSQLPPLCLFLLG